MKLICVIGAPLLTLVEYVLIVIIAIVAVGFALDWGILPDPSVWPLTWLTYPSLAWLILWLIGAVIAFVTWTARNYRRCRNYWQSEEEETDG